MNGGLILSAGMAGGAANAVYSILVCSKRIIPQVGRITPTSFWALETWRHVLTTIVYGLEVCLLWAFGSALLFKGLTASGPVKRVP